MLSLCVSCSNQSILTCLHLEFLVRSRLMNRAGPTASLCRRFACVKTGPQHSQNASAGHVTSEPLSGYL